MFLWTVALASARTVAKDAEPRELTALTSWEFAEDATVGAPPTAPPAEATWTHITVPHIFRQSGLPDNAAGWYRMRFTAPESDRNRSLYLMLEGAASVKDVFVNGRHVGRHLGAFSAAAFDLTPFVVIGQPNQIDLRVSNRDDEAKFCLSRSTLYFVNGGLFRKAWLVKTGAVHVAPDMGSSGVYLTPSAITATRADLGVRTVVRNPLAVSAEVRVLHRVTNPTGAGCAQFESKATIPAGQTVTISGSGSIDHPVLWDLGKPNLYTVRTEIWVNGKLSDVVTERTGIRKIEMRDQRFFLNGREVRFLGVCKHAQNEYAWNAVTDEDLRKEWDMMQDIGGNTVRLPHYPHSQLEYEIGDERGIAIWAENGFAGQEWSGPGGDEKMVTPDGERLTRELVRQNWNHPSILFWSCGNEAIEESAGHYAGVLRQEDGDKLRLVTYAACDAPVANCDFVAWNTYDGWYGGHYNDFINLKKNMFVAETGSGDWITHHVPYGTYQWSVDKYEPEEYAEMFAEFRLQTVCRNDTDNRRMFLWWNFREFYDRKFKHNRNTKGLLTLAGAPKDLYYLFQSFLNQDKPVVHINGRYHFLRHFAPDNGIKAYSNAHALTLAVNGVSQGKHQNGDYQLPDCELKGKKDKDGVEGPKIVIKGIPVANVFFWKAQLQPGRNLVEVTDDKGHTDRLIVYQRAPDGNSVAESPTALVQELQSSNPKNPAVFIDRPVEAQGPFFTDIDGSSDNTFDVLPKVAGGAAWIATRRLSDPTLKTDLSFRINGKSKGAKVSVLFSTGTYPTITLIKPDVAIVETAGKLADALVAAGFKDSGEHAIWRDQQANRANAAVWTRSVKPGERIIIPGQTLDYVVLIGK